MDIGSTHTEIEILDSIANERIGAMVVVRSEPPGKFARGYLCNADVSKNSND